SAESRRCVMTVSAISSSTIYSPTEQQGTFRQTFAQLIQQIQSGDLQDAQQTYEALTQMQGNGQGAGNTPMSQLLGQIGQALQNDDIAGAQQAVSSSRHGHHGHGHAHGGAPSTGSSSTVTASNSNGGADTNAVDILT